MTEKKPVAHIWPVRILLVLWLVLAIVMPSSGCPSRKPSPAATDGKATRPTSERPTVTTERQPKVEPFKVVTVADGLAFPSKLAVAPDGKIFFNELRQGNVRVIDTNGRLRPRPFATFRVVQLPETGLLGIAVHPGYPKSPFIYVYATRSVAGKIENQVIRLREAQGHGMEPRILLRQIPAAGIHNGGELAFGPDGKLYISTGDAKQPEAAQDIKRLNGKILRMFPDGTIPESNPIPGTYVYSRGHRNVFGLAFSTDGVLYNTENGPDRFDEINRIVPGGNYGWPNTVGPTKDTRFKNPLRTYTPNIAPTGATFITSDRYGTQFKGNMLFGDFNTGRLHRLVLSADGTRVTKEAILLREPEGIFDVTEGPDGSIYFTTGSAIKRLQPVPD